MDALEDIVNREVAAMKSGTTMSMAAVAHAADGMEETMTKTTEVVDGLEDIVNREVAATKSDTTMSMAAVAHVADGMVATMTKTTEVVVAGLGDIVSREVAATKSGTTMSTWLTIPKTTVIVTTLAVMISHRVVIRVIRPRPSSIICKKRVGSKRPPR